MKICYATLEKLTYRPVEACWRDRQSRKYVYVESCQSCGAPFLKRTDTNNICCDRSCAHKLMIGGHLSAETKKKISKANSGRRHSKDARQKMSAAQRGKKKSENHIAKGVAARKGYRHSSETKAKLRRAAEGRYQGVENPRFQGGPGYSTYAARLGYAEEVRPSPGNFVVLEVRCVYCGRWFVPSHPQVKNRLMCLEGKVHNENRFYCSEGCKAACPIYKQVRHPRGHRLATSREVQPELRQMVLKRDGYTCQKCGATIEEKQLHCHHTDPVVSNPLESADIDICVTLCVDCHHEAHRLPGCSTGELAQCA